MNTTTSGLLSLFQAHNLVVANTEYAAGDTYYGLNYIPAVLDHTVISREWADHTTWCRTFIRSAWRLQSHHTRRIWDHAPLACVIPYGYVQGKYHREQVPQISGEALAMMVQRGWQRAVFVKKVESALNAEWGHASALPASRGGEVANTMRMETINSTAIEFVPLCESPLYTEGGSQASLC
eukprot:8049774-Pyramimonas_sp.AAC.1